MGGKDASLVHGAGAGVVPCRGFIQLHAAGHARAFRRTCTVRMQVFRSALTASTNLRFFSSRFFRGFNGQGNGALQLKVRSGGVWVRAGAYLMLRAAGPGLGTRKERGPVEGRDGAGRSESPLTSTGYSLSFGPRAVTWTWAPRAACCPTR